MKTSGKWQIVYEIINLLTSVVDTQRLFQLIIQKATELLGAKAGSLMLIDEQNQTLSIKFAHGLSQEVINKTYIKLGEGIAGYVAQTGQPLFISDITKSTQFSKFKRERYETKSLMCIPLKIGTRVLGVINITTKQTAVSFNENDLEILTVIANAAAIAIENAKLVERLQHRVQELSILYQLSARLIEKNTPGKVFEILIKETQKMVDFSCAIYFTYHKYSEVLVPMEISGLDKEVLQTIIPFDLNLAEVLCNSTESAVSSVIKEQLNSYLFFPKHKVRSLYAAPLCIENELFGILVFGTEKANGFTPAEQQILKVISANTAHIFYHLTQLLNQAQLASMGEFIASIAHDLKSPLGIISDNLELAQRKLKEHNLTAELLRGTKQETQHTLELINQLLRFSNPDEFARKYCDINELLSQVVNLVDRQAQRREITIITEFDKSIPLVWGNASQIKEVALNLITNAFDAMPTGGNLIIKTTVITGSVVKAPIESINNASYLQLIFRDTGEGIPEKNLKKIFSRFYTTKANGTGLGLMITQKIIQGMGGFITVESEVNKGTRFYVHLPLHEGFAQKAFAEIKSIPA